MSSESEWAKFSMSDFVLCIRFPVTIKTVNKIKKILDIYIEDEPAEAELKNIEGKNEI